MQGKEKVGSSMLQQRMNELGKISADLAKSSGGKGESGDSI